MMKLNILLAKTEHSASQFKKLLSDYVAFFKSKQSDFQGWKKTYQVKEGVIDDPSMRGNVKVVTTVKEKLAYLEETTEEHVDNLFSVEATNASGTAKAALIVENIIFGDLSSLELLRLKSLIESGDLEKLYENIPVRSDAEEWEKTASEQYKSRDIYELPQVTGIKKTITKESFILTDPNIDKLRDSSKYQPVLASKDTIIELGDYTAQKFSGEFSHRQRAEILRRRSTLLSAVIEALKTANEAEVIASAVTARKLFGYLHGK